MSVETFSSQARQTRTALMLSSTTLLVYSLVGDQDITKVGYVGSTFDIPAAALFWLFLATSVYFFSFLVAGTDEYRRHRYLNAITPLRKEIDSVKARLTARENDQNEKFDVISRECFSLAQSLGDVPSAYYEVLTTNVTFAAPEVEKVRRFISDAGLILERHQGQHQTMKGALSPDEGLLKETHAALDKLETEHKGLANVRVGWFDYKLPLIYGPLCVSPVQSFIPWAGARMNGLAGNRGNARIVDYSGAKNTPADGHSALFYDPIALIDFPGLTGSRYKAKIGLGARAFEPVGVVNAGCGLRAGAGTADQDLPGGGRQRCVGGTGIANNRSWPFL